MKKILCIILFSAFTIVLFAQSEKKNTISLTVTPLGAASYGYKDNIDGGGGYDTKSFYSFGIEYNREVYRNLEITTGILYVHNKISFTPSFNPIIDMSGRSYNIDFLTIPILVKYHFLNYLFVNGGGVLNFKISDNEESYHDGKLGFLVGIGAEHTFSNNITLNINPYFQMNSISPDKKMNFFNLGVKLGIGYNF
ncbi:outer membrane beta-barrel protein [Dysgonomonas sp. ZJ279]|uniref:outer membrane beta-barrel protein n=1 Tax=Dysgonomonas sp. ZJ279 TaxID=2709796 RepID=UPI0013E9F8BF|nr:outer membrane beta-barrel protein [Dysgonomonas sp. ZJ279]